MERWKRNCQTFISSDITAIDDWRYGIDRLAMSGSYMRFWLQKLAVESNGTSHILDSQHIGTTKELFDILNSKAWMTYHTKCKLGSYQGGTQYDPPYKHDLKKTFEKALEKIAEPYNRIRKISLLDLAILSSEGSVWDDLEVIWHELGAVKTVDGLRDHHNNGEYYKIAVCKPLMFLWGQTPSFDNKNVQGMIGPKNFTTNIDPQPKDKTKWTFKDLREVLIGIAKQIRTNPQIDELCHRSAKELYNSDAIIPYGRFVDYLYYEKD